MRRLSGANSEIAGGFQESLREMILPDAVHHHAPKEWILRARQPLGQCLAPPRRLGVQRWVGNVAAAQHTEKAGPHFLSRYLWIPSHSNKRSRCFATHIDDSGSHGWR